MKEFLTFLKEFTFFALAARVLLQLRPRESYEKYLRLLTGVMMLAMVMEYVMEEAFEWIRRFY